MSTTTAPGSEVGVRFGRLERRGLLLGLSAAQVAVLGVAAAIATAAVYTAGMPGLVAAAPVWGPLMLLGAVSVAGRPLVAWVPVLAHWHTRRLIRATVNVTRPAQLPAPGVLELPGIPGRLVVTSAPSSGAALVLDRRAGTVTAIARLRPGGFLLAEAAAQDRKVAAWGRVLAGLGQSGAVVRVQVLHRTVPGGAGAAARWWAQHALPGASVAARVLAEQVAEAQAVTDRPETLLAVAVRTPTRTGRTLTPTGAAEVERRLAAVADALSAADLPVTGWVTRAGLGRLLRAGYDPAGAAHAPDSDDDACGGASLVGPMGVVEAWDHVRTDSAVHAVYWVAEWPRATVHAGFLQPLLLGAGARRSFTLLAEPLPAGRALREIRRAKVEHAADAAHRARVGQIEDEATRAEAADIARREADLVAGHGDLRFTGLITVTAPDLDALAGACAATETAAAQAMCELRRLVGQQGQAHATATLPLARGLR